MMLPKRNLGETGMALSIVGLGTVKLGRDQGVKYPGEFAIPGDREAKQLLELATELGINTVDTAPAYGSSEERLGQLLKGGRQRWHICSKVGEEFDDGRSRFDFSPAHTRFSVERSLTRLATDYLDIVLVHSDGNDLDIIRRLGTLETLAELKAEGKIRAFGMSTKTPEGGLLAAERSDCVMVTWNLQYDGDRTVIDYCQRHRKGVLVKKALASGHLADGGQNSAILNSFRMLFSHPGVTSAIIGTIKPQHLRSNVQAAIEVTSDTP